MHSLFLTYKSNTIKTLWKLWNTKQQEFMEYISLTVRTALIIKWMSHYKKKIRDGVILLQGQRRSPPIQSKKSSQLFGSKVLLYAAHNLDLGGVLVV